MSASKRKIQFDSPAAKRSRKTFSEKLQIIDESSKGESKLIISRQFNCSETAVREILKQKEDIKKHSLNHPETNPKLRSTAMERMEIHNG